MYSGYADADMTSLWNKSCLNASGRIQLRPSYATGVLPTIVPHIRQIFQRITATSATEVADVRFEHFMGTVLPKIKSACSDGHCAIIVPSYFDYVRLRNAFTAKKINYVNCCEYTLPSEVSRSRSAMYHGRAQFMLITERFHFFHRYRLRGLRHFVFYAPPLHAHFYAEFINMIEDSSTKGSSNSIDTTSDSKHSNSSSSNNKSKKDDSGSSATGDNTCMCLFTRYDLLEIERIVGTTRTTKLLSATNPVHMFL
jgi:U3 small nucleolar RNA-associated protein 25